MDYFLFYKNSLKITFLQTTLTLLLGSFVAYGFAMYSFKGKTFFFGLVLLMMTTPVEILMLPSFAAMGIFVGMNSWNSFILPVLLLSKDNRTLPVFLEPLLSPYKNYYDLLIVGAVFSVIPIMILFAAFQRYFIAGMTAGGVKE